MKLAEALKIYEACDPEDCDCDTCPIGQDIEYDISAAGVSIKSTICGMIIFLKDICEEEK